MDMTFGPPSNAPSPIPPRVAAAQDYLRFAEQLRNPPTAFDGQSRDAARDLTPKEQAVYDAALEVLRLYFTGEQDFAPAASAGQSRRDDDDPKRPQPANA